LDLNVFGRIGLILGLSDLDRFGFSDVGWFSLDQDLAFFSGSGCFGFLDLDLFFLRIRIFGFKTVNALWTIGLALGLDLFVELDGSFFGSGFFVS
jgi:hypothetical protein